MDYIQNKRESYDRFHQKHVTEVLVQIKDEDPAWIPEETFLALLNITD
jgi:hypothetical protein|tara:strand:- start:348 stop:491 length:144 start_codon:yes stop_codon:yes gene_type:complete